MLTFILEAAFRSLLMALAVWGSIRLLRVRGVLAQKVAWVLVLLAAGSMPFVMRSPWLALNQAMSIPVQRLPWAQPAPAVSHTQPAQAKSTRKDHSPKLAKPSAAHRSTWNNFSDNLPAYLAATIAEEPAAARLATPAAASSRLPGTVDGAASNGGVSRWHQVRTLAEVLYFGVAGILLLRMLAGLAIASSVWRRAVPTRMRTEAKVRVSRDLSTPVTIGSTILLPADCVEWDLAKLRVVLAHEQSHVRQRDFYLQLLAAFHAAVFWFSPLGWWLQRKISELGEALSDRAGLEQAPDAASYARILLEFAAIPRTSFSMELFSSRSVTGVAMARSSNLAGRIERILNDRRFRLEFLGGRRHALLTALLVPAALVAAVACIRIVPAVEAARGQSASIGTSLAAASDQSSSGQAQQVTSVDVAPQAPAPPVVAPTAPEPPAPVVEAPEPPDASDAEDLREEAQEVRQSTSGGGRVYLRSGSDGQDSFAIIGGSDNGSVEVFGNGRDELKKVREKYHGNFIWFRHGGKSYVITDPAIVAQSQKMFAVNPALAARQAELEKMQGQLQVQMEKLEPLKVEVNTPEFKQEMAKLNLELAELQKLKIKEITDKVNAEVNAEVLADLQEKMGAIQGHIGEIQGKIGERQGELGEKQGEIGEKMGKLGEEMGRIGEEEGKKAEEASKKMRSVFEQAIKDGKAKPVE